MIISYKRKEKSIVVDFWKKRGSVLLVVATDEMDKETAVPET